MMKISKISSLMSATFLIQTASAFDPGIIREIKDINQQKIIGQKVNCSYGLMTPFESKKSSGPEYNDCAVSLCGHPDKNPSAWLNDANFSKSIPTKLKASVDKLDPVISKIYDKAQKQNLAEIENLKTLLNKNAGADLDPKKFGPTFKDEFNTLVFGPYIKEQIDPTKPIEKRLTLTITYPANASENYKKAINEFAENYKTFAYNDYYSFSTKKLFTDEEITSRVKEELKKSEEFYKNVVDKLPPHEKEVADREMARVRELAAKNNFPADASLFFSSLIALETNIAFNHPEMTSRFSSASCLSNNCQKAYVEFIKAQDAEGTLKKITASLDDMKLKERSINRCKANIIMSAMTETNNQKAKEVFETAKKAIMENVLPRFSAHSRKILSDYINKKLIFSSSNVTKKLSGPTPGDPVDRFKAEADSYLKEKESMSLDDTDSAIKKIIVLKSELSNVDPFSDSSSPCSKGITSNAWDAFLPVKFISDNKMLPAESLKGFEIKDQVFVSDFSCTHDQRGKQATAHEIGHAINFVFANQKLSTESLKKYKSLRQCATENYNDAQKAQTLFTQEGDSIYTEEDNADLFAFMSFPKENDLFTCSLLKPAFETGGYTELDFIDDSGDTHSTSFARVLIEAINKNVTLPVSCQRIIQNDQPSMSLKKCI